MTAEAEMRAVIAHAAEKLGKAKERTVTCSYQHGVREYFMPHDVLVALGYAQGVLHLLASYLKVDEGSPTASDNGHQSEPSTTAEPKTAAPLAPRPWVITYTHSADRKRRGMTASTSDGAEQTAKHLRDAGHHDVTVRHREGGAP